MRFSDAPARKALRALSREPFSIREALKDPARLTRFTLRHEDLIADFSKSLVSDTALGLLLELAEQRDLAAGIEAMFRGDAINLTEKRSVLHVALRSLR